MRWTSNQLSGCSLPGRDEPAHAVGEDLRAAAGQRPEPCVAQLAQHLLVREAAELRHVVDLARGEQLQVHVRHRLVELRDDLDVVVEVDVRALAADHVDLGEAAELALAKRVLDELLGRVRVGAFLLLRDCEGAELALHAADVRLVEVEVLDEVDLVVPAALTAREIRQLAEREDVVRLHQQEAVLEVEPLAGDDLLADRSRASRCGRGWPLRSPVYHGFGNRLQLVARLEAVEARQCPFSVVAGDLPGLVDRAARRDSEQRAVE